MPEKEKSSIPKPQPFQKELIHTIRKPIRKEINDFSIEDDGDDDDEDDDEDDVGAGDVDDDKEYEDVEGSEEMLASNNGDSFNQGYLYHCSLAVKKSFFFCLPFQTQWG